MSVLVTNRSSKVFFTNKQTLHHKRFFPEFFRETLLSNWHTLLKLGLKPALLSDPVPKNSSKEKWGQHVLHATPALIPPGLLPTPNVSEVVETVDFGRLIVLEASDKKVTFLKWPEDVSLTSLLERGCAVVGRMKPAYFLKSQTHTIKEGQFKWLPS